MKPLVIFAVVAATALPAIASADPPPPYDDTPATYPWRNGVIEGPGGPGPGPGPGPAGYGGGPPPGAVASAGEPGPGPEGGPGQAVFPAPNNGAYVVSQNPDSSITVTRFGPVWSSSVGPKGWAHRHYYRYGWPFSSVSVPFVNLPFGSTR